MAWIAVDAGTSVIKAMAFGSSGEELAVCRRTTEVLHPVPGHSEQDMEAVWMAVAATVRDVAAGLGERVQGIAMTAQGDGCWLVDGAGRPTGKAILWNDGRATEAVKTWSRSGVVDAAAKLSGSVPYPGLANAILHWLREHEPRRLEVSRWALSCNGWLFLRMTGNAVAELSDASNPFCEAAGGGYSDELLRLYGVAELKAMLPPIAAGEELRSTLLAEVAEELGVPASTPVVMAPYDIVATAYGAGVTEPGQACVILGTTICAETIVAELEQGAPAGTTIALGDGLRLRAMPTLTGCETLEWAKTMLQAPDLEALEALAAEAEAGAGGVFFLPYLSPAGERAPFLEPGARGSLHGLSLAHTRAQIARAFYEGLTYGIRECLEAAGIALQQVRVCGGGARSGLWCQMIADVTGVEVLRTGDSEPGARGACLVGMKALGEIESLSEGTRRFGARTVCFAPDPKARAFYAESYPRFVAVREHARQRWGLD